MRCERASLDLQTRLRKAVKRIGHQVLFGECGSAVQRKRDGESVKLFVYTGVLAVYIDS